MKLLIQKYNPVWIKNFLKIKQELEIALAGIPYQIEHVGSTSVPDLDAKLIIDVDIIYKGNLSFEKIKAALLNIGYYHNGDQGIPKREVFKREGIIKNPILDSITHHLYVCLQGSQGLERHLLSRDYLRKHQWAREKYQQMKYEIADKVNQDKKAYAELKELTINNFIDEIIEKEAAQNRQPA